MSDTISKWYEDKQNVAEMVQWNKGKLKKWEKLVADHLPKGAAILDIGCGMGREAFALSDLGFSVVGIDISQEAIAQVTELAGEAGYHIPFLHYDGHTLPFEDESFDVVIIWAQTFGLLYGDAYKNSFLQECRRVLKNDGFISFSGHDYEYLTKHHSQCVVGKNFYPYANAEIYWETFLPHELASFAESAGFSVILCERGEIYKPEDGVVLHCLGEKAGGTLDELQLEVIAIRSNEIRQQESYCDNWELRRPMFADEMRPVVFRYLGITPESYVLDGGWGTGVFTRYIARGLKGGKIVGFDISKTLVAYGRSKIEEENLSDTCELNPYTLVFDAGDTFHGQTIATLNKGESVARLMNEMGFNAMASGNHDFNYGCEWLVELDALTDFSILAANVKKDDGSGLLDAYVILEVGGLSIGVFGLATPETTSKTNPNNIKGLIFTDPTEAARQVVEALQDETDIIIALTHLGMDGSSIDTSIKLAETVEGIDLIVDGHSHTVLEQGNRVGSTLIVSTGEYGQSLGIVDLYYKDGQIVSIEARLLGMDSAAAIAPDEAIVSMIEMIEADQVEELMRVVGSTAVALEGAREKVRTGETNLGNLITDAMVSATGADCALLNGGGIRASIDAGEITVGEIINVLPFGNYVITKRVTGADIKAALEHGTSAYPELAGGFPHVSGMRFVMDLTREPGSRVVDIFINGQPLDLDKQYILATVDFLAAGGDPCTMLKDAPVVGEYGTLDEIVRGYIQAAGTVNPAVEGRITVRGAAGEVSHLESN